MPADFSSIEFATPAYLWLLAVPAALLTLWAASVVRRLIDLRRLRAAHLSPIVERWSVMGDLPLWLCVVLACAAFVLALARPHGVAPGLGRASLDLVVLQDGSASMYVDDVPSGTRWTRSMQFLRRLGDALRWDRDRLALTVFARMATPQVRLTHDPNTVLFFLDHLGDRPPLRLDDETTWDTNVERGITWGLRVLRKDREVLGASPNVPAFLLMSDGESWSGEAARAVDRIRAAGVPLFVVGVGTVGGGPMPPLPFPADGDPPPVVSRLDRGGLQRLAMEGGGRYFELDREPDADIANGIIDTVRRAAPAADAPPAGAPRHWYAVALACAMLAAGTLFARRRAMLGWELAGATLALVVAWDILR